MRSNHRAFAPSLFGMATRAAATFQRLIHRGARAGIGMLLVFLAGAAAAGTPRPLHTELTLTHIAADRWRADYAFAEPVTQLDLGARAGSYRQQAWRVLTP